jgi:hypothetical protein
MEPDGSLPCPQELLSPNPFVTCAKLIVIVRSYPTYLKVISSIRYLRTRPAMVTRDPLNIVLLAGKTIISWAKTSTSASCVTVVVAADIFITLVTFLAYSSTLKTEVKCSSETLVNFQQTTRRYIPEARALKMEIYVSRPRIAYRHRFDGLATGCVQQ